MDLVFGIFSTLMLIVGIVMLLVAVSMLAEAYVSRVHERELRAAGAVEPRGDVYAVMRVVYPACFLVMAAEGIWRAAPSVMFVPGLVVFALAKALKWWAMASLGTRWTFRVLVPPDANLVNHGPYGFTRHPNYVAVLAEIAGVAMMLGALWTGALACAVFGSLIWMRIRVEEEALGLGGARRS